MSGRITSRSTTISMLCFLFFSRDVLGELIGTPSARQPDVAGLPGVFSTLVCSPSSPGSPGPAPGSGCPRQGEDLVDDLVDGLLADLLAALGAVGVPTRAQRRAEVVVDLRHRAHGGPGVLAGGLLVNGDGGGGRRCSPHRAFPSGPGASGRRRTGTPHTAAGPRRKWCRRPGLPRPDRPVTTTSLSRGWRRRYFSDCWRGAFDMDVSLHRESLQNWIYDTVRSAICPHQGDEGVGATST